MARYYSKKILNDGIKFDSKTESDFYDKLKANNIKFKVHEPLLLQDSFRCNGKGIRKIEYEADFIIYDYLDKPVIIDCKGSKKTVEEVFKLKFKMLKNKYREQFYYKIIYQDDLKTKSLDELIGGK